MAKVIVTFKIMPQNPTVDLKKVTAEAEKKIIAFAGDTEHKVEQEPIAFGLVAIKILFVLDEAKGGTEGLEAQIEKIKGVQSVEVIDVRRIIG
jgi:elongation factor 1-beta